MRRGIRPILTVQGPTEGNVRHDPVDSRALLRKALWYTRDLRAHFPKQREPVVLTVDLGKKGWVSRYFRTEVPVQNDKTAILTSCECAYRVPSWLPFHRSIFSYHWLQMSVMILPTTATRPNLVTNSLTLVRSSLDCTRDASA